MFTAGRRRAFGRYQILVALLRFDTSSLPDNATVTSAKLRLHVTGKADDDNRCLVGEWYPSSNWPIDPADWTQTTGTSALVGADLTGIAVGTSNELNLSGVAAISVSGYTGLRLGISGGQPSGDNYLQIAALEHTSNPEPQLVVTYTTSGGPTAPVNTSVPVVSGVAQVGESLSASTGSWVGTAPVSYAYRWQRCSPACVEIPGATTSSYPVVAADLGATLRVGVTGSNTAGSSEAFSAQTPAVTAAGETTLTFNVSANADDGDVTVSGSVGSGYPPSGAAAANSSGPVFTAGRRRAFGNFQILVPLLRFDTSSLPDNATVTSAKLRLHVTGKADDDNRSLVGEWYPSSNWPIDPTDWTQTTGTSALVGADLTGIAVGTSNELNLSGVAAISVSGYTGLRLGISGGQPSGDNYLQIAALEHASNPEPQLVVTYTTP